MSVTSDVAILGAGIIGAACANALSREGLRVSIIEPTVVAGGATAAGMGHIVVMDDSAEQFALTNYSRDLWQQMAEALPPQVEFETRGTIWVAADDEEMDAVRQKHAYYMARRVRAEVLESAALGEAEPNLRPGLAGGLLVPDDSIIYAPCAADWFLKQAQMRGATLHIGQPATEVRQNEVRLRDGTTLQAGSIVCATGTWAVELFPGIGVRPRKGHLAITDRYPEFVQHQLVELGYLKSAHGHANESVAFNVHRRSTGQVLIGSSRQYGETSFKIDQPVLSRMLERAIEYMPGLARLSVMRTWTGFRAATEDKLPLIGPCPGRQGVYLATGHEGLGITTCLATAELITCLIIGREPAISPIPYLPARITGTAHA